jgi:uncharacterized protein
VLPTNVEGMHIIRNTMTDSIILVDKQLLAILQTMPKVSNRQIANYSEEIEECKTQGILVSKDKDEMKIFHESFQESRYHPETYNPYVAVTTGCNLNCSYCYEDGIFRGSTMNKTTIKQVIEYCTRIFIGDNYKDFWITLYGGEPLLNYQLLQNLILGFKKQEDIIGAPINFDIVTNATLLSQERARWLVRHGLQRAQITFDGNSTSHNLRRRYPSGKGTFNKILNNLIGAVDIIPEIRVRCNFDSSNRESLYELIDILADRGLSGKVFLYFAPINEIIPTDNDPQCAARFCSQYRLSDAKMAETLVALCGYAKQKGFETTDKYEVSPCMSTIENGVVIDPEGNLYKCLSFIGRKEFIVGTIWGEDKNSLYQEFMDDSFISSCYQKRCPYIPICGGGCRFEAFVSKGDYKSQFCRSSFVKKVNNGLTKLHYSNTT